MIRFTRWGNTSATFKAYEIYKCPENPNENGVYYAKVGCFEQAIHIVKVFASKGTVCFLKGVDANGNKFYL